MSGSKPQGLGPEYKKASACSNDCCCVEAVLAAPGEVAVRDSKTGGTLRFSNAEWRAFVAGVKAGEFDLPDAE